MTTLYGIWLDHAHAFIVKTNKTGDTMEITELHSNVPPHHRGGVEGGEHHTIVNQHKHGEIRKNEMQKFMKDIISRLKNPDEVVIFGPGTAKNELKNEIAEISVLAPKLTKVETTDKLNEHELKAEVMKLLNLPRE